VNQLDEARAGRTCRMVGEVHEGQGAVGQRRTGARESIHTHAHTHTPLRARSRDAQVMSISGVEFLRFSWGRDHFQWPVLQPSGCNRKGSESTDAHVTGQHRCERCRTCSASAGGSDLVIKINTHGLHNLALTSALWLAQLKQQVGVQMTDVKYLSCASARLNDATRMYNVRRT